ncbi:zinc finger protein [Penicillium brevicompactum]|uniref:Zinc finger MYND-type n=1 Tax=Penicillium brevicompactum TaxID=5074 RepID=UPI002541E20D|nr:Zinc finger MYND-type [Penicillium brevicompactum]KAJ5347130.1 Zinc finger MYND-type [Penicillium brevicompactum]
MASRTALPSVTTKTVPRPAPNGMGNGLFATTDMNPGDTVLHIEAPFVAILDSPRLEDTCAGCFGKRQVETGSELKACTGCRVVKYCDRTCQSKDWKFAHSLECPIFKNLKPMVLPNNARALLRMVLRSARNKYDAEEFKVFEGLETHINEISESQGQLDRITLTARAVKNYSGTDIDEGTVSSYAAKLDLNSFNLTTSMYDRIGLYLHPYAGLINHSCDYNATVGFDGPELYVKALRPIKQDEQVFISYIDTTTPYDIRRNELKERYFFDCLCTKCQKGTDTIEDQFITTPEDMAPLETAEREALGLLQTATGSSTEHTEAIEKLEAAMHKLHETGAWPLTRQPYASLRDKLIISLLSAGKFTRAFIHAAIRYVRIDPVVYDKAHPIRHIHAWSLVRLTVFLSQEGFPPDPQDPVQINDFKLNFHYLIWYILAELASTQSESCTVPSFKKLVGNQFVQVHNEFKANDLDPSKSKGILASEWQKLERLVTKALAKE